MWERMPELAYCHLNCAFEGCKSVSFVREGVCVNVNWDCELIKENLAKWSRLKGQKVKLSRGGEKV
jgi:hypothetical protein